MSATSPRLAIIGTGALGGYYGGLLARRGLDVHFLVRSDFDHVRQHGLRVDSIDGDYVLRTVNAHLSPSSMPRCGVAVVCLKTTENHVLPALLPQLLEPRGTVVLLQNGLGEEERIADIPGVGAVVSGLGFVCATKIGPGHVQHLDYGGVWLAEYQAERRARGITPHLERLGALLADAGIKVTLAEDWLEARWKKLVWNVPFNGLAVLLRADTRQLLADPSTRALARLLMLEVTAAAAAEGRAISEDFVDRMISDTTRMRPYAPSMRVDFDAGRALETEAMYRVPIERGASRGVAMPCTTTLATALEFLARTRSSPQSGETSPLRSGEGGVAPPAS